MPINTQKLGQQLGRYAPASHMAEIGEDRIYLSVAAAVHDFEQRNQPTGES